MRLSSLLPMLLLLASPVSAQLNCNIFDLSASVVQFDTTTCKFFVVLDFQHAGTTNQFHVKGNGVNYGTFGYNQVPVTIGPIMANPQQPLVLNFLVQDAVFQDCSAQTILTVPGCSSHTCEITDLTVAVGDCGPASGSYSIKVDFEVSNPGSGFFELHTAGGVSLGVFPLASLPLTIPNFPWGGGVHDILKVCIKDNPDCCKAIEFLAPDCVTPGCGITGLFVNTGDCLSDSTYKAKIGFQLSNTISLLDSFKLYLDGSLHGVFGINQLPLTTVFETTGNAQSIVEVCVTLPTGITCCMKEEFDIPVCFPPCGIKDLKIETDSCTSDSTFGVWLNFAVNDSTAVDSFQLWGNGNSLGTFGMNQLPLNIPNFEWNGLIFNTVRVCTGNIPACCKELQFLAPDCLPFDSCEVTSIHVLTGPCTSDSTYKLTLNFNATNPGNGTFIVWANGVLLDTFNLTDVPLMIPNFPWNGGGTDIVTVCILGANGSVPGTVNLGCCKTKEFPVPDCLGTCEITNLKAEVGDCDPNTNTYPLTINFGVVHPGNDSFDMYVNGQLYGTYPLNQLPLHIPNFPHSGNIVDVIKICINDQPNCCAAIEVKTPDCDSTDCHIEDLSVIVGDCNPAGGYQVKINFVAHNPGNDFFDLYINGQLFGIFPLNQLPLTIPNFPGSGNPVDVIKICIHDHPDCCVFKEVHPPICDPCDILNLTVDTGDCNPDSTYHLTLNFNVINTNATTFVLFGNGMPLGTYNLNQLPLHIPNFPWDGQGPNDVLKVCVGNNTSISACCETIEFPIPDCLPHGDCEIFDLVVDTGDCNSDSTYKVKINFQVQNPPTNTFGVWANGVMIGTFNLNQLPITIQDFPWGGGNHDVIKICFVNPNGIIGCCKTIEFQVPDCLLHTDPCDIVDLHVITGNCTSDSTYQLTLNFGVTNPPANLFGVWANGQFLGMYGLGQLPLTFQNFPWDGGAKDVLKVCFTPNFPGIPPCCESIEFNVPDCLMNTDCEIYDLVVDTGDCTSDSTYNLVLNFQVNNPISSVFRVWANGQPFGTFNLSQLPLTLNDFPWGGGNHDVIKVCFVTPNGIINCCKTIEFAVPDCLNNGGDCEIFGMVVDPGNCTSDSTYNLFLNFQVQNPPSSVFGVWANGMFQGTFNLSQLPLNFPNFPWDGGAEDVVKVCFVTSAGTTACCRSLEFDVPDCLGNNNDCHLWDLLAVRTGCLCGQFFVAVTFNHENGGAGGFDLVGNGNVYGNYPYNTQQPIILGPFPGDGTTVYEFGVVDHNNGNCEDGFVLGMVECQTPVTDPGTPSSLVISPNPASNWTNITAMLENGTQVGQASVKIYAADGRLVSTQEVSNAANFQLDVSNIPAGVYRLSIQAAAGRLEGAFTKQ
jgi:Secretion system C-terminal sorting domain